MTTIETPTAVALVNVPGIELVAAGQWDAKTGTTTFTMEDLASAVGAMDCPGVRNPILKLGHDEPDDKPRWDGEPAVGWIENMRLNRNADKIIGDYMGLPEWLADVLPTAYPDRSIEMWRPFICQIGHRHNAVITAVALLGVQRPGVGVIESLQDVKALFTESGTFTASSALPMQVGERIVLSTVRTSPLRRDLTKTEEAAKTDFVTVQWQWEDALDRLLATWQPVLGAWQRDLVEQVSEVVDDGRLTTLANLSIDTEQGIDLVEDAMLDLAERAMAEMRDEARRQGVTVPEPTSAAADSPGDESSLPAALVAQVKRVAATVVALMGRGLAFAVGKRAVQAATPESKGVDVAAIVGTYLDELSITPTRDQLGIALSTAQNAGRIEVLQRAPQAAYYASEVLDARTCKNCSRVDGQRFADLEEVQAAYTNGGYVDCLGHLRCRGTVIAVWDEFATASTRTIYVNQQVRIEGGSRAEGRHVGIR